jgi:hypothetical protein
LACHHHGTTINHHHRSIAAQQLLAVTQSVAAAQLKDAADFSVAQRSSAIAGCRSCSYCYTAEHAVDLPVA